jgi:transcriptional regulator with XRE-family HTH domain
LDTKPKSTVDTALLKYYVEKNGDTMASLAKKMGISPSWLSAKVNASGAEFWQSEIMFIIDLYKLSPDEVCRIFFAE